MTDRRTLRDALGEGGIIPPAVDDEIRAFLVRESPLARLFPAPRPLTRRQRVANWIRWHRWRLGAKVGSLIAGQEMGHPDDDR